MFLKIITYIKNHAYSKRDFVFDIILPKNCLHCKTEGSWLCDKCRSLLTFKKQYCLECKTINETGKFCSSCQKKHYLNEILIAGDYDNKLIAKLIKKMKYHFAKDISLILGDFLINFILDYQKQNHLKLNNFILIPVPLHKKRKNFRGFNQSEEIAKYFAIFFNLKTNTHDLIKIKNTKAQAKLNESE